MTGGLFDFPVRGSDPEIDAIIDSAPDGRGVVLTRLREAIHESDPEIVEVVKWKKPSNPLGAAVFERDGIICLLVLLKGRVRLSFADGAGLPDPKKLFNAQLNGKSRGIDFPVGVAIDVAGVQALVRAAVRARRLPTADRGRVPKVGSKRRKSH